jgi:hypothetical protein
MPSDPHHGTSTQPPDALFVVFSELVSGLGKQKQKLERLLRTTPVNQTYRAIVHRGQATLPQGTRSPVGARLARDDDVTGDKELPDMPKIIG